ncbi:MAG: hypothetical protein Q6M54_01450 [Thermostichus sp. DRC_bins_24]
MKEPKGTFPAPKSAQPAWISLALSLTTAPLLLGLVLADRAGKWLGSLTWEDPGWWLGERLPNLDPTTLRARQQQRKNSASAEGP